MSAAMPCGAPSSLTRWTNAGGKLYSRPHNRPTTLLLSRSMFVPFALSHAGTGLENEILHHRLQVARPAKHLELPIGTGAFPQHYVHVLDVLPASKIVDHIVNEFEQLQRQIAHRHFGTPTEVDKLAV